MANTTLTNEQIQKLVNDYNSTGGLEPILYIGFKKLRPKTCKRALRQICHKYGIRYGHVFDDSDEWNNFVIRGESGSFWQEVRDRIFDRLGVELNGYEARVKEAN